jgi:hypothetical protein
MEIERDIWQHNFTQLTKQLWVRRKQQFFFYSSDVNATTMRDSHGNHNSWLLIQLIILLIVLYERETASLTLGKKH